MEKSQKSPVWEFGKKTSRALRVGVSWRESSTCEVLKWLPRRSTLLTCVASSSVHAMYEEPDTGQARYLNPRE